MTRKHFTAVALMLRDYLAGTRDRDEALLVASITRSLASEFSVLNARFDFDRFYTAVGLDPDGFLPVPTAEDVHAALEGITA